MRDALALLWRVRLAIAAALLAVSAAAIVRGHHDAWAGNRNYTASLTDDLSFVGSTVLAFGAVWVGAYSPAYVLCLSLFFGYQAVLNVATLLAGGFVIRGSHGCFDCVENALLFVNGMLDYVFSGLLATAATRAIVGRSAAHLEPPGHRQANPAFLILLPVAWFKHTFYLDALNQPAYVMGQLARLSPYFAAALLASLITALISIRYGLREEQPRHIGARIGVVVFLFVGLPVLELFFVFGLFPDAGPILSGAVASILAFFHTGFSW
jgi:hypothetical protein